MGKLRHLRQAFPEVISQTVMLVLAGAMVLPVALLSGARPVLAAAPVVSIQRVSLSSAGSECNGSDCGGARISADGRYVAFGSSATNLVPGDINGVLDGFVHDRQTGETARVSLSWEGSQGNDESYGPSISADGRYVAFHSLASNLVPDDTNGEADVFVHDRQTGETARVSLSSGGTEGNGKSIKLGISADGRYVAFMSDATNLVPDDTNAASDIFVHDRKTGQTARVSLSSGGTEGNGHCWDAGISADGRYVAFHSLASNLVPDDTNGEADVFVHDRQTGETTRVSLSSGGTEGNSISGSPSISADGRYVAFVSLANNLVPGDTNREWDTFVRDRQTGQTTRVSMSSGGKKSNGGSGNPSISADGRYVAFDSGATNLVPGDTNGVVDVFVHDRQTGQTVRVSLSWDGNEGNDASCYPSISADGRYVAFWSDASNLVPDDTNGFPDIFVQDWAELSVTAPAGGLPGGVIAGIVIGAVAVVGAVAFFWFRRPKKTPPVS